MKLLQTYVLLKDWAIADEVSEAGIFIPSKVSRQEENTGTVAFVADAVKSVQPGQKVYIKRHLFDDYEIDGVVYLIGKEEGILAVC